MNPTRLQDLGATLLRVALGVLYLAHVAQKVFVFTLPGTAQFFASIGLPGWLAYLTTAVELAGGLALLAGVRVRTAALVLLPFMLGAVCAHLRTAGASRRRTAVGNIRRSGPSRWPSRRCSAAARSRSARRAARNRVTARRPRRLHRFR